VITTERLVLRRWRDEDRAPYAQLCADPEVMRWIGDGSVASPQEASAAIDRYETSWEEDGFGLFALEDRATAALVGFAGLAVPNFLPEVLPAVEIGWRLGRTWWGRGLATEAAAAVRDDAFDRVGLDRLVSIHQVGNDASARIMEKLGMSPYLDTVHPTVGRAVRVWELCRSDGEEL
jgi:RimJ/RimL family protein N-acetyltransferase